MKIKSIKFTLISFLIMAVILSAFTVTSAQAAYEITLKWPASSHYDLTGYRIHYKTTSSGGTYDGTGLSDEGDNVSPIQVPVGSLGDPNNPEYTISDLTDNKAYYFVVTAYDSQGRESEYSNEVDTRAPQVTSTLTVTYVSNNSAIIEWTTDKPGTSQVNYGITDAYGSTQTNALARTDLTVNQLTWAGSFAADSLVGYQLRPYTERNRTFTIVSNTATTITTDPDDVYARSGDPTANQLTWAGSFTVDSLIGLELRPYADKTTSFTILDNDATTIDTDPADGNMLTSDPGASPNFEIHGTSSNFEILKTEHSVLLTGLTEGTTYHFQVTSEDFMGNGATREASDDNPSPDLTFTTSGTADGSAPVITAPPTITGTTSTSFTVRWETDEPGTSVVYYGTKEGQWTAVDADDILVLTFNAGGYSAPDVNDLDNPNIITVPAGKTGTLLAYDNAQYKWWIESADDFTAGEVIEIDDSNKQSTLASDSTSGTKLTAGGAIGTQNAYAGVMLNPDVGQTSLYTIGANSADAVFIDSNITGTADIDDYFRIFDQSMTDSNLVTEHVLTITGLSSGIQYYLQVASADPLPNGPTDSYYVGAKTDSTADTAGPTITLPATVVSLTENTAIIQWGTDEPATSVVDYGTSAAYGTTKTILSYVTDHITTLTGLASGTLYHFRVRCTDTAGNQTIDNNDYTFTSLGTPDTTPPQITSAITVTSITNNSAMVHWQTDEASNSVIYYGTETGDWDNVFADIRVLTFPPAPAAYTDASAADLVGLGGIVTGGISGDTGNLIAYDNALRKWWVKKTDAGDLFDEAGGEAITISTSGAGGTITTVSTQGTRMLANGSPGWTQDEFVNGKLNPDAGQNNLFTIRASTTDTLVVDGDITTATGTGPADDGDTYRIYNANKNNAIMVIDHSVTITGLTADKQYYLQVASTDPSNNGPDDDTTDNNPSNDNSFVTTNQADEAAPVVSNIAVTAVTGSTAVVTWQTDEPSNSIVQYGTSPDFWDDYESLESDAALLTEHSVVLTGLISATSYSFRVGSTDAFGNGPYLNTVSDNNPSLPNSFITGGNEDTTAPQITSAVTVTSISDTTAVVQWQTNESGNSIVQYGVASADWDAYDQVTSSGSMATSHSVTLTGLTASTQYHFRIGSVDASGNGPATINTDNNPSLDTTFTTSSGPDTTAPQINSAVTVTSKTNATAVIEWNTSELGNSTVYYGTVDGTWSSVNFAGGVTTLTASGTPDWSNDEFVNAKVNPDLTQKNTYTIISNDTNSIDVSGDIRADASDGLLNNEAFAVYEDVKNDAAMATSHQVILSGLSGDTIYHFSAASTDAFGNGPQTSTTDNNPSGDDTFTTDSDPDTTAPQITSAISVTGITQNLAVISWQTSEPGNSIVQYDTSAKTWGSYTSSTTDTSLTTSHQVTLTGLAATTEYHIRVGSFDASGNGPDKSSTDYNPSVDTKFTTSGSSDTLAPQVIPPVTVTSITQDSAVVKWQTDEAGNSVAYYGTETGTWDSVSADIRVLTFPPAPAAYTDASAADLVGLGGIVTGGISGDTGNLIAYDNALRKWWVKMTDAGDLFDEAGGEAITISTSGAGGTITTVSTQGTRMLANGSPGWTQDEFVNGKLNPDAGQNNLFTIRASTTDTLVVDDDITTATGTGPADDSDTFSIYDSSESLAESVTIHSLTLTGLSGTDPYYLQVASTDATGNGPDKRNDDQNPSHRESFTLSSGPDSAAPQIISTITIASITNSSAVIEWQTDEPGNSEILFGTVSDTWIADATWDGTNTTMTADPDPVWTAGDFTLKTINPDLSQRETYTISNNTDDDILVASDITAAASDGTLSDNETFAVYDAVQNDADMVTTHRVTLTGLNTETEYFFQVRSTDAYGNGPGTDLSDSNPSLYNTFKTAADPDLAAPQISAVAWTSTVNSVTITWSTDEPGNSVVQYGASSADWDSYLNVESNPSMTTFHSVSITGLDAGETYYYRVGSTDAFGNGPALNANPSNPSANSTFLILNLADDTPPVISAPSITATSVTNTTAVIQWTTNEPSNSIVKYDTGTKASWSLYSFTQSSSGMVTSHSVTLTGLSVGTYYYMVGSTDASGNGPNLNGDPGNNPSGEQTHSHTAVSDDDAPDISSIDVTVTHNTATITWDTNEAGNSMVRYGSAAGADWTDYSNSKSDSGMVTSHSVIVTGLTPLTTYHYRVGSTDIIGNGPLLNPDPDNPSDDGTFITDTPPDNVAPYIVSYPVVDFTNATIDITYSEANMQQVNNEANYTFDNGLDFLTDNDFDDIVSLGGNAYRLFVDNILTINTIYELTINSNVKDAAGNSVAPSTVTINDNDSDDMPDDWETTYWGNLGQTGGADYDGDGLTNYQEYQGGGFDSSDPTDTDSDNDDLPDKWEHDNNLDPNDATDDDDGDHLTNPYGKNGDKDNDGWTNYEEYLGGTNPDNGGSQPVAVPPEIMDAIPHDGAGVVDSTRVPDETSFYIRLFAMSGINTDSTDAGNYNADDLKFTIVVRDTSDTIIESYTRNLDNMMDDVVRIKKLANDDDKKVIHFWGSYDRSKENSPILPKNTIGDVFINGNYQYASTVTITVDATDTRDQAVSQSYSFKIEASEPSNLPDSDLVDDWDSEMEAQYDTGIQVNSGTLTGAKIIYDSIEPVTPILGPDEIPTLNYPGIDNVGVPMNLQPPTVFNEPVKILIPCPGHTDVSTLSVYYYNGQEWVLACDADGNVQPGGEGWMVPGSRVNNNSGDPSTIAIKIYHFSGVQAGKPVSPSSSSSTPISSGTAGGSEGGGGGGCFIATAAFGSPLEAHVVTFSRFRDKYLAHSYLGQKFVDSYYRYSPDVADYLRENETTRTAVRWALIPVAWVSLLSLYIHPFILMFGFMLMVVLFGYMKGVRHKA